MTRSTLHSIAQGVYDGARLMVGMPSYDGYLAHMAEHHPDAEPMDYKAFFRNRQDARYGVGGKGGFRCC